MSQFWLEMRRCKTWSDDELASQLKDAALEERESLIAVLVRLGEFDRRELDLKKGYPNLYEYCMRVLKHSRSGAARRIAAARAGRRYPSVLAMVESGELSLVGAAMLAPHLKPENRRRLLRQARGRNQEEIARLVAEVSPQPARRDTIRIISAGQPAESSGDSGTTPPHPTFLAAGGGNPESAAPPSRALTDAPGADLFGNAVPAEPVNASPPGAVYAATLVLTERTRALLLRAREILRHKVPGGDFDPILRMALELLLDKLDRDRRGSSTRRAKSKAPGRRRPTESDRQEAWERDGGQCAYVGSDGIRCTARAWLEFDHEQPYALGGSSSAENIRPMCRPHNQLRGRLMFVRRAPN